MTFQYFYEPRTGHRFRSKKEVEKFIQTGEVPRYKPKPKTSESNVVHKVSFWIILFKIHCWDLSARDFHDNVFLCFFFFFKSSQNSNPTPRSDMVLPPSLEFYIKHLQSYMSMFIFSLQFVITAICVMGIVNLRQLLSGVSLECSIKIFLSSKLCLWNKNF